LAASDGKGWKGDRRTGADRRGNQQRRRPADRRGDPATRQPERRVSGDRRVSERRSGHERRSEEGWEPVPLEGAAVTANDDTALVGAARAARDHARARFSNFKVGAALETTAGEVITGCNIENATYGLTMCAERVALYKALSEGRDVFTRVAVVADTQDPTPPCGSCRQLLWEYCGDIEVVIANLTEVKRRIRLSELLPLPFDAHLLKEKT
jgi:cytidine deaminase